MSGKSPKIGLEFKNISGSEKYLSEKKSGKNTSRVKRNRGKVLVGLKKVGEKLSRGKIYLLAKNLVTCENLDTFPQRKYKFSQFSPTKI